MAILNNHALQKHAQVRLAEGWVVGPQRLPRIFREPRQDVGRDGRCPCVVSRFQKPHPLAGRLAGELGGIEPLLQGRVVHVDKPLLDQFEQPADAPLGLGQRTPGLRQMLAAVAGRFRRLGDVGFQYDLQPFRREQAARQEFQHHPVQRRHGDAAARTSGLALLGAGSASVVAVSSTLPGTQRHAGAAGAAARDAGEERRAADHTRRHPFGVARLQAGLHQLEIFRRDDRRHLDRDPLFRRLLPAATRLTPVEVVDAGVGGRGEDAVHAGNVERLAAVLVPCLVQAVHDRLDPQGHAGAAERQVEDMAHDLGLALIDGKYFLGLLPALLRLHDAITKGRHRAVPEALARIFLHGTQGVLGVFAALVFVEAANDLPDQVAGGAVAKVLRHRDDRHIHLAQLADVHLAGKLIAEEPRHGVHQDDIERACG